MLVQIVVGKVQYLQHGKGAKSARQRVEPVDRAVQNSQLRHGRKRQWQLLEVVVGKVQDFQVVQVGNTGWNGCKTNGLSKNATD